ncbi:conserved Plasmodium protein, unknown function [Plasmodium chabaudi chabaudi]|uniref:Uncharacterized protein n=1 Tax=Plasmodium chabaudi chabaudi TaxID=31271 RepID=A0A1D3LJ80_PLACU|nr:conserved Plasmodium protein, unknown function [Plasmodium chabaudi chabaudi]
MNNNLHYDEFKEDNYIKAWIKQSENPELFKDWNDIEDTCGSNELTKVVGFNNFNSNLINVIVNEHANNTLNKKKKRKAYSLFYSNEHNQENFSFYKDDIYNNNSDHNNYNNDNWTNTNFMNINNNANLINENHNSNRHSITSSFDGNDTRCFTGFDNTPACNIFDKSENYNNTSQMSPIKKMKRENICAENNDDSLFNNFMGSSPFFQIKKLKKISCGSESTSEFFNNYLETPTKAVSSNQNYYDLESKKGNSTNTTKENTSEEYVSSNNSASKRTINYSNKTDDFNDYRFSPEHDYLSSSEYVDEEDPSRCLNKKQSEVNFLGQKLDYKIVEDPMSFSKNHSRYSMI